MEKATALRQEGVAAFEAGDYTGALPKFKAALQELGSATGEEANKLALSCNLNSASSSIKLGKFEDAVEFATAALAIDKKSAKALYRRGQARRELKQFSKARIDLVMAMELQPDNKEIENELNLLRQQQGNAPASSAPSPYSSLPPSSSGAASSPEAEMLAKMLAGMGGPAGAPPPAAKSYTPKSVTYNAEMQALKDKAEAGDKDAQFKLGENFDDGKGGFPKDPVSAFNWYIKAADQGHPTAKRFAAWSYKTGTGTPENVAKAIELYSDCAKNHKDVKAMACLGFCYDKGDGVKENLSEAVKWYTMAAEEGDAVAQVNLALCYEKARGVEKNLVEALKWHRKAAEKGNLNAYINVGLYYEKGEGGVAKDMPTAFGWYKKAAEAGDPTGMAVTGWCYEKGEGVAVDTEQALDWYTRGAMKQNSHAQQGLKRLMEAQRKK